VNRHELQTMVTDILGRTPDLIHGFNEFLERCESMDLDLGDMVGDAKSSLGDAESSLGDAERASRVTLRARWVTLRELAGLR
jgi:hypothetical protein